MLLRTHTRNWALTSLLLLATSLSACGNDTSGMCSDSISVAGVSMLFSHGLDNISENQYAELKSEVTSAYAISMAAVRNKDASAEATHFAVKLQRFVELMDKLHWDFSKAILDQNASDAATDIGTSESLQQANVVESYLITTCGMPSTIEASGVVDTLPMPVLSTPTQTDPAAKQIDPNAPTLATGKLVAEIFEISVSDSEALCLGNALSEVVDATSTAAELDGYTQQFAKAFALCGLGTATSVAK